MKGKAHLLKDKDGNKLLPYTSPQLVQYADGKTIDDKVEELVTGYNSKVAEVNGKISEVNGKISQANSDHSTAVNDHGIAAGDHSAAGSDHNIAVSDHSVASGDHSKAASDHSTAVSDHSKAAGAENVNAAVSSDGKKIVITGRDGVSKEVAIPEGGGVSDAYTKAQTDALLEWKANASEVEDLVSQVGELEDGEEGSDYVENIEEDGVHVIDSEVLADVVAEVYGATTNTENVQQSLASNKYWNTNYANIGSTYNYATINSAGTFSGSELYKINVSSGETYKIYGYGTSNYVGLYVLTGTDNIVKSFLKSGNRRTEPVILNIEEDGVLYVNLSSYNADTDKVVKVVTNTNGGYKKYVDDKVKNAHLPFLGKKIVCFGDSLTEFKYNGLGYTDYLAELSGANVVNVGIGGTQIRQRTTPTSSPTNSMQGYAGLDMVNLVKAVVENDYTIPTNCAEWVRDNASDDNTSIISRLQNIDWNSIDVVTLFAGTNDFNNGGNLGESGDTNVGTTLGAINFIVEKLLTTYPHLSLYIFTPVVRWYVAKSERNDSNWCDAKQNSENKTLADYVEAIKTEAYINHIPVCDLYHTLGWNKYNFSKYFADTDGTHPYYGFKQIARKMFAFIRENQTF